MSFGSLLIIGERRGVRTSLHLLIALVLLLRSLTLILKYFDYQEVAKTGSDTTVGFVAWALIEKVQNIAELMMFLLIALGWKVLRGTLDMTEVRFAVGISVLSFYLGVSQVACTTTAQCSGFQLARYILHTLCYLVVIVAMNFNLQRLMSMIADSPATIENGRLYQKLYAYQVFRWVFLGFIIAPTAELFLKVSVVPWDAEWLYICIQELRRLVIYMLIAMAFRPEPGPLRVFELTRDVGSDDEAGEIEEGEDTDLANVAE
eukprot:TRINITY_DN39538_c0_g1_i1.p1 TRINITY_DN39538_c0_g1~~TRINITY_DN39538_c0_g1_i1.p1  ORF type:complete len:299 (-),score=44.08 TRINITY_DN39538_c0_g1_i1:22-804(-)